MPIIGTARFTERIKFFDGQRLFASDLQDLEQFNREMRWLHNQSLHQAGVASGYAVSGNKDDREVTIQPGYAIDSSGREIVLTQPEVLQVPPVANDGQGNPVYYDLTVSYPDDLLLKETETRDGICASRSAVRRREKPVFCWVELVSTNDPPGPSALSAARQTKLAEMNKAVESGARIRLARAEVLNCKLNQKLSVTQRRNAKPALQPFMSAGRTGNNNKWTAILSGFGIKVTLKVDTTLARFRGTPRYFAHVVGDREVKLTIKTGETTTESAMMILDGFGQVEVSKVGFNFSLLIPAILIDLKNFKLDDIVKALNPPETDPHPLKDWSVEWLGVEG